MTNKKKTKTTHQTIKCDTAFKHYIEIVLITTIFNGCFHIWQTQWSKKKQGVNKAILRYDDPNVIL